jgi:hypothetical protein
MDDAPNWPLTLQIVGIVVAMAFVPLLPLAVWKLEQWWTARRKLLHPQGVDRGNQDRAEGG